MRLVVFGLSITSSWGNGHATLWRGLVRGLAERGHTVTFFERDVPWYAAHRDQASPPGATVVLYETWSDEKALAAIDAADATIVTSYCPDARAVTALLSGSGGLHVFYDLDTPVTLLEIDSGREVEYLPADGLRAFDLALSFTGGAALDGLRERLGARAVAPLYGSVDVDFYRPGAPRASFAGTLSHLGTYSGDRHDRLVSLFVDAARARAGERFVLGGSLYPPDFAPFENVVRIAHVQPTDHPDFYASCPFTLNVTRGAMARMGYCPSGRLFEAAACETAILTDRWAGLEQFFTPGQEILVVQNTDEVIAALRMPAVRRREIAAAARARVLHSHTSRHRAAELEAHLIAAGRSRTASGGRSAVRDRVALPWDAGRGPAAAS